MGFFDTYTDEGGGSFLGEAEKKALAEAKSDAAFAVKAVREGPGFKNKGRAYVLTIDLNGEERQLGGLTIGPVPSRDRMIAAMAEEFENGSDPIEGAYLYKVGQAYFIGGPGQKEVEAK